MLAALVGKGALFGGELSLSPVAVSVSLPARKWMRICFELLDPLKPEAPKRASGMQQARSTHLATSRRVWVHRTCSQSC